ncbi:MAG: hypothetical protein QGG58_11995, partial [Chloroflexota bacterium]|nr:hypothetical protein [Chloroflexota bacterium]
VASIDADVVINIQGDEPLVDPELIDQLAGVMVENPAWDMGTAAAPITSAPTPPDIRHFMRPPSATPAGPPPPDRSIG